MRRFLVFLSIMTLLSCINTTSSQTPDAVKTAFKAKYPGENDPDWHQDKHGNYEAHFKQDGISYRADYDSSGKWIETESNIKKEDLPEAIQRVLKEKYDDNKIYEIEKVDHHSKGTFYDVELEIDGKKKDIEFNAQGNVIN